ncbi:MAG: ribonuclease HI family protein [Patescibacteria group bacterium]|nr:ribonuclease HI family protein [Patescibacteria group bacterium]
MENRLLVYSDGGSRGNPGPAAIGFVIKNKTGQTVFETGKSIGAATNNMAEYEAIIAALEKSLNLGAASVDCFLDSELAVRQLNGVYKIKDARIKIYSARILVLRQKFKSVTFSHIPREKNQRADFLVNRALDTRL